MENLTRTPIIDQERADRGEIVRLMSEGKRITDPELRRRVRERADEVRRKIFDKHGLVDWAVGMIRDARDE